MGEWPKFEQLGRYDRERVRRVQLVLAGLVNRHTMNGLAMSETRKLEQPTEPMDETGSVEPPDDA